MSAVIETANNALSTAAILAIAIPCAVAGVGLIICISITIYCACCRQPKTTPGMILQPQAPQFQPGVYSDPPHMA